MLTRDKNYAKNSLVLFFVDSVVLRQILHLIYGRRHGLKVNFYDLRKPNIDALAQALNTLDWSCITDLSDVDLAYDKFLTITTHLINSNIPLRTVTISENTPTYITPLVKSLLRKRNKQLRRGETTYAHSLSVKIGKLNAETREKQLSQVSNKDIKKLWSSVRSSTSQRKSTSSTTTTFSSISLIADLRPEGRIAK